MSGVWKKNKSKHRKQKSKYEIIEGYRRRMYVTYV